eukprot:Gregarina_sp_Poly_1__4180@NODE_2289_length_2356_cov_16_552643_g1465_i0_p3_GENE_NODE_2289_length_2356_cov_16_552643_g1465_i0NODE_2289_length_2356_cov_16_552643_g1465_i0_p3_ORF_typecomplete_len102_score17_62_NODE_2289_length_2356_cov_16_552643_g1465_i019442249
MGTSSKLTSDPERRAHVEDRFKPFLEFSHQSHQQDETILSRDSRSEASDPSGSPYSAMDAVVAETFGELQIENDMRKAALGLAIYETQRFESQDAAQGRQD